VVRSAVRGAMRSARSTAQRTSHDAPGTTGIIMTVVTILYLGLAAYAAFFLIYNFVKSEKWEEEALYVIVLIPFLLRIFGLK
jgi:glycopeptide antibiotics resistance protein